MHYFSLLLPLFAYLTLFDFSFLPDIFTSVSAEIADSVVIIAINYFIQVSLSLPSVVIPITTIVILRPV